MKSTREKILNTLLDQHTATIAELAQIVGINGISVRHHLINLQAEGLVTSEEQRHGVGRPRFSYSLTAKGIEKFPSNYLKLTNSILDELKRSLSADELDAFFIRIGEEVAEKYVFKDSGKTFHHQLEALCKDLVQEGYRLRWKQQGNKVTVFNQNCPFHNIAMRHPEICQIDHTMFNNIFKRPAVYQACIVHGDPECAFSVVE